MKPRDDSYMGYYLMVVGLVTIGISIYQGRTGVYTAKFRTIRESESPRRFRRANRSRFALGVLLIAGGLCVQIFGA